jgi:hypothetical protein
VPLVQRNRPRTPSPSPGNSGSALKVPNGNDSGRLLSQTSDLTAQTRLDRLCRATPLFLESNRRWFLRLTGDPTTYTAARMKEYLQETLGPQICELKLLLMWPEGLLTEAEESLFADEYHRLAGKAQAITMVLMLEAGKARRQDRMKTRRLALGSEASAPASLSITTPGPLDPFETE